LIILILTQTALKTAYEIVALPLTNYVVNRVKKQQQTNVFDNKLSYNPFKIKDI